jgi:hypothetical protein
VLCVYVRRGAVQTTHLRKVCKYRADTCSDRRCFNHSTQPPEDRADSLCAESTKQNARDVFQTTHVRKGVSINLYTYLTLDCDRDRWTRFQHILEGSDPRFFPFFLLLSFPYWENPPLQHLNNTCLPPKPCKYMKCEAEICMQAKKFIAA